MLKAIKVNKRMRLDELIKYAWENDIKNKLYYSDSGKIVKFLGDGNYESGWDFGYHDSFSVKIEEEITEDTEFEELYTMMSFKSVYSHDAKTIKEIKECFDTSGDLEFLHQIYAMVDGKLQLIYEREE